ncbi:hypothetical protein H4582DRAFT_2058864 [Lactarius indigo]|nr:hypothetical protein H4582DRAFT_2058864 [Lactarius indigo]
MRKREEDLRAELPQASIPHASMSIEEVDGSPLGVRRDTSNLEVTGVEVTNPTMRTWGRQLSTRIWTSDEMKIQRVSTRSSYESPLWEQRDSVSEVRAQPPVSLWYGFNQTHPTRTPQVEDAPIQGGLNVGVTVVLLLTRVLELKDERSQTGQPACAHSNADSIYNDRDWHDSTTPIMAPTTSRDPTGNEHSTHEPSVDNGSRPQTTPTRFVRLRQRIYDIIYDPKPTILQLISWFLTVQIFSISVIWYLTTLPIRISAYLYEYWIRALFPKLPSVRKLLNLLRSAVLSALPTPGPEPAAPGDTSSGAGSNSGANPAPTLNVDLSALRGGGI